MTAKYFLLKVFSLFVVLAMAFSYVQPPAARAQGGDGLKREVNAESGRVSFIRPEKGASLSAARALGEFFLPQEPAMALAVRYAPEFGLQNADRNLSIMKSSRSEDGRQTVRFQQSHEGIPVMGGELIVNTDDNGDLYSISGEVSPGLKLSTQPAIDAGQARETALKAVAKWYEKSPQDFVSTEPELWIYDESLLLRSTRPTELTWRMDVTSVDGSLPVRELVLVGAERGGISLHFNQDDTAWQASARAGSAPSTVSLPSSSADYVLGSAVYRTYTTNHGTTLPGTQLCTQATPNCTNGANPHADAAHKFAKGTYDLYATQHSRDSINNAGMALISTVQYGTGYANAFWSGTQMVYGDAYGFALADDVVAHELTHGVTDYEFKLFYYYQSGAINESFSDLWGEYYDQTNGLGNDTAGVKWQMGEDVSGWGALRSMSDPTLFGDPDSITSPYYNTLPYYDDYWDNGGVHSNSGVNNKAVYLMVDGAGLGWTKVAAIYYEVQSKLLTSGADYSDLYYALQQACTNLVGQKGISAGDCTLVKNAADAVAMNAEPDYKYNPDTPLCTDPGMKSNVYFAEDFENGVSRWTFTKPSTDPAVRWQYDIPGGSYAQSGVHSLFANDWPEPPDKDPWSSDAKATLTSFVVPQNAFLWFAQAYEFEFAYLYFYDGGVLEYSTNGGTTWVDAGPLMEDGGYNGSIYSGFGNPLGGRSAFLGSSHGYISTRLNLGTLAGKTVRFRWRMGLDGSGYATGWAVDNIKMYTCTANTFADVPASHPYYSDIEILAANNMTGGCATLPLRYCPDQIMNRAQAAAFMLRGNFGPSYVPPTPTHIFKDDWTKGPWAEGWAEGMRSEGFSAGCLANPLKYCPWDLIPREQAVIFALKMKYGKLYTPPPATGTLFADMTNPSFYATAWAEQAYKDGIILDCGIDGVSGKPKFCPKVLVSRGLAAYHDRAGQESDDAVNLVVILNVNRQDARLFCH